MALTDKWLKSNLNKLQERRFEKAHRDGLSARVSLNGAITFQYRYYLRDLKKYDRVTIGYYPEMSLAAAAAELPRLKVMLKEGRNPKLILASDRLYESSKLSLDELFEKWYVLSCKVKKKNHQLIYRTYEMYIKPKIGTLKAEDIRGVIFIELVNTIIPKFPAIAERIITNMSQMYKWARLQQISNADPMRDITATTLGVEKKQDTRFFSEKEICYFFLALDNTRVEEKNKIFMELSLHYGCRPAELRLAEKEHINIETNTWLVPFENHKVGRKTKQPIVRPIIPGIKKLWIRAMEISESKKWVFTNSGTTEIIDKSCIPSAMRCIEHYWRTKIKSDGEPVKCEHFHSYTLRKTARTNFADFGEWAVCEKMVGHKLAGDADKYDYNTYTAKMIPIYQQWFDYVERIRRGKSNVVYIKKANF